MKTSGKYLTPPAKIELPRTGKTAAQVKANIRFQFPYINSLEVRETPTKIIITWLPRKYSPDQLRAQLTT